MSDFYRAVSIQALLEANRFDAYYFAPEFVVLDEKLSRLSNLRPLHELADIQYGFMPTEDYASQDDGLPLIRVTNILSSGNIDMSDVKYVRRSSNRLDEKLVREKDILMVQCGNTTGKTALVPKELEGFAYASFCFRIRPIVEDIIPEYLCAVLQSDIGQQQIWRSITYATVRPNTTKPFTEALKIPIPPRPAQDRIAQLMQHAYIARREKLAEAERLLAGIDGFVLRELGVQLDTFSRANHFVISVSKLLGKRFDIGPYANGFKAIESGSGEWVTLKEVAHLPRHSKTASRKPIDEFIYIGMPDVDDETAEVRPEKLHGNQIRANKTVFKGGDVVFARIEPCIYNRKIALIPPDIDEALGSTELLVARAKPERILPGFLLWILRSELIQRQIQGGMTGTTGRRRLPSPIFANLQIPKIALKRQEEIATEAFERRDKAEQLRLEAETVVTHAKAQIERLILGEEVIPAEDD